MGKGEKARTSTNFGAELGDNLPAIGLVASTPFQTFLPSSGATTLAIRGACSHTNLAKAKTCLKLIAADWKKDLG